LDKGFALTGFGAGFLTIAFFFFGSFFFAVTGFFPDAFGRDPDRLARRGFPAGRFPDFPFFLAMKNRFRVLTVPLFKH
jgi:hypothetical protein